MTRRRDVRIDLELHRSAMRPRIFPAAIAKVEEAAREFDAWVEREAAQRKARKAKGQSLRVPTSARRKKAA